MWWAEINVLTIPKTHPGFHNYNNSDQDCGASCCMNIAGLSGLMWVILQLLAAYLMMQKL